MAKEACQAQHAFSGLYKVCTVTSIAALEDLATSCSADVLQ